MGIWHILRDISKSRHAHFLELEMSQKPNIWTKDTYQEYLVGYRGFFKNFDFLPLFWALQAKKQQFRPFFCLLHPKKGVKNANFQKSLCTPLDISTRYLWTKFKVSRTFLAPKSAHGVILRYCAICAKYLFLSIFW